MKLYRKQHNRKAPPERSENDGLPPSGSNRTATHKETVGLKEVTTMVAMLSKDVWCPHSMHFRRHFNALIRFSLTHTQACGDTGYLSRLVNAVPDKKSRAQIIAILTETFPIRYLAEGERPKFRKESGKEIGATWDIEDFDVFKGSNHTLTETDITLHRGSYERREALDLVLDVLTTYRNDFSLADVQQLEQTLSRIKDRASQPGR